MAFLAVQLPSNRNPGVTPMRCRAAFLAFCLAATRASAQQAPAPAAPSNAKETPSAVLPMGEPLAGDHWTYESRDEVTGKIMVTREHVVTEVTPTSIGVRL